MVVAIYQRFIICFRNSGIVNEGPLDLKRVKQGIFALLGSLEAFYLNLAVKLIIPNISYIAY